MELCHHNLIYCWFSISFSKFGSLSLYIRRNLKLYYKNASNITITTTGKITGRMYARTSNKLLCISLYTFLKEIIIMQTNVVLIQHTLQYNTEYILPMYVWNILSRCIHQHKMNKTTLICVFLFLFNATYIFLFKVFLFRNIFIPILFFSYTVSYSLSDLIRLHLLNVIRNISCRMHFKTYSIAKKNY